MSNRMTPHSVIELLARQSCGAFAVSRAFDKPLPAVQKMLNALVENGLATIDSIRIYHLTAEGRKEITEVDKDA